MISPTDPGVVLVDKLPGKTSFSVVRAVRKIFGVKKVGHAGTLDPFASGLLVVCIGRPATRLIGQLMEGEKSYRATVVLGKTSTTQDPEGEISDCGSLDGIDPDKIEAVLAGFRGRLCSLAIFIDTGAKSLIKDEQQSSRPQQPRPPIIFVSWRTPIWRISTLVRNSWTRSLTSSRKSTLFSAVK